MIDAGIRTAIDQLIPRIDYFRRPPSRIGGEVGFKEWMHFCVYGEGIDLLINFSEVDDLRPNAAGKSLARMTVLARRNQWRGGVEAIAADEVEIVGGRVEARFGDNTLAYEGGRYHVRVRLRDLPIAAELTLEPVTTPAPIHNVSVGDGPPIHWLVIPRLRAHGTLTLGAERIALDGAPAYHDHNWGHFGWGRDFAWEWGFGLPAAEAEPWSFVFARLSDRGRNRTRMQTLFLWRGAHVHSAFRDAQITVLHEGLFRAERVLKIPPIMGLIRPGTATDVPALMTVRARSGADEVEARFTPSDVAQVIIPNDADLGVTIIHEVAGDLALDAVVGGERVEIRCPTIFEFLSD